MKWISNLWPILLFLFVSCGGGLLEKTSAPKGQGQAGIIASCTTKSEATEIASSLGIQFRVINENRKLIEFIGISKSELAILRPHSKLTQNKVYEFKLISGDFEVQTSSINYPFYGAHPRQERTNSLSRYFPHISQINGENIEVEGEDTVIAVIDTGVYYNHPHISPNIYTNEADLHGSSADGYDSDGNGYVDDYVGWDFYNGDAYPIDDNGHGTHVAGLAASTYSGVAPKAKILPIKVLSSSGSGDLGTIAAGIYYAIDRGADIINMSLGGSGASEASTEVKNLIAAIDAGEDDVLIIAAAGNGGDDGLGDCNDSAPVYPANIQKENMIAVAAVDAYNELTSYSNFGGSTVHIAAPGGDTFTGALQSLGLPTCFGSCSSSNAPYVGNMGTSMATPIVAGLAALIKSKNQDLSPKEIKEIIMNSGSYQSSLNGLIKSSAIIDVQSALNQTN